MKHYAASQPTGCRPLIKLLAIIISIQAHCLFVHAQQLNRQNDQLVLTGNHYSSLEKNKKKFWKAAGEWAMMQALPWAYDRYIRKADFAKISFKSIDSNFHLSSWEWDDNKFCDNQFMHPFHGNLFFNTFRSNGYNFWESIPAAVLGSYTWETVFETHVPAPNDIINTAFGGIVMGEMNARLAQVLVRRLKYGKKYSPKQKLITSTTTEAGMRQVTSGDNKSVLVSRKGIYSRLHLQYGESFSDCKVPFDNFSLLAEIGNSDTAKLNSLQIEGCIYGKKMHETTIATHVFNISMNYDYMQNNNFVYGAQSIKANLLSRINLSKNVQVQLTAGTGIIALAAVHNTHMYYGEGRNYDYCSGISLNAGASLTLFNKLFLNINTSVAETITVNGYKATHLLQNTGLDLRIEIYKGLFINAATKYYVFNGYYKDYDDVTEHYSVRNIGLGYRFPL
ncbi:hypothetical protein BH10BAC3_BH10BAC3_25930 [soil metagenome]